MVPVGMLRPHRARIHRRSHQDYSETYVGICQEELSLWSAGIFPNEDRGSCRNWARNLLEGCFDDSSIWLQQNLDLTAIDARIVECIYEGRSVPIALHRASRPARTAAATVSRVKRTSAPRNRPSTRRGFTTGAWVSSTRRMLPSGSTVASKSASRRNSSALPSRP